MQDYLFRGNLADLDPDIYELTQIESERQYRKLILIPSESSAPFAVREALASAFQNIYAEGYPNEEMRFLGEAEILDQESVLAHYRRYGDRRYYKGVEYANTVESLARRRCAEAFATQDIPADQIFANVQVLSGAPANNAVYHALIKPGETVMGMNLLHGGHLTHGSPANRSGKLYNIVSYGVDPETERIDFDVVEALAREHQPKMIIAGFSSYPWCVEWTQFRKIADLVGAYLLADIAHIAGLVAAGEYPSPVGIADVVTFTTHKSLCGPRGAAILTTSNRLARRIDRAVFPGEQGGPHVNTIAAQAVAFKLARTDQFRELQVQIKANCAAMTEALKEAGFRIPYGGTDTHLTNIDVTSIKGLDGSSLSGGQAARILDLAGIVVNRNTIPGDKSPFNPSGLRLGTPWVTQRGFKERESVQVAKLIAELLNTCTPYSIQMRSGVRTRAKVDFNSLNSVRIQVRDLAQSLGIDFDPAEHGYPHFYYMDDPAPEGPYAQIEIIGDRAADFLYWSTSADLDELGEGNSTLATLQVDKEVVDVVVTRTEDLDKWILTIATADVPRAISWLRDLSDGFVAFDPEDPYRKLSGPVIVRLTDTVSALPKTGPVETGSLKPWFIGIGEEGDEALPGFSWDESESEEIKHTALTKTHREMGAKMVPFAGWDMPVWYTSLLEEHVATRTAAGLFDVSHMGVYQVEGRQASDFLDSVTTNDVAALEVGASHYTQFLDPDGAVIDDTMIYRRSEESYLVVVNASNDDVDWAWLNAVQQGRVQVDRERPWVTVRRQGCRLRNLRDPAEGDDMRVDIAIQGPMSREILIALGCDTSTQSSLEALKWAGVMEGVFGGFDLVVSRTGYTGERVAFELFVHPERSVDLWKALLDVGEPLGLKAVGLGARDSLRTEAGLPLYGHEMAGEMGLGVGDAGFASYVKVHKPWFIGRKAYLDQESVRKGEVVRFRFNDKGVRMAHYGDPVVDRRGQVIGKVTSCAVDSDGYLLGQAYVMKKFTAEGTPIAIFQSASKKAGKAPSELKAGDRVSVPTPGTVLSRFPQP
ncbi:MAG: glycine cleavage system aminomethyltransferase GcvT [Anaerolineales bacterium]|nr:glycine cleavage system aminomethyltransferase GcvT [Anaerolineales bacterium]